VNSNVKGGREGEEDQREKGDGSKERETSLTWGSRGEGREDK